MAFSPLRFKSLKHGRSLSLPSKSPLSTSHFDESLSASTSLSSFSDRVHGLTNLYSNIDESLLSPHIQQIISQEPQIDQVLDGHIRLLDGCTTTKDLLCHVKGDVQELLSALRRNDVDGVNCYLTSRRKSKKMIQKLLKGLSCSSSAKDGATTSLVCMLNEAESGTFTMLESLLCYVMGTNKTQARQSGWSLVSKLMHSNKVSHQVKEEDFSEFNKIDNFLVMKQDDLSMNYLKEMESSIQILEEKLEYFSRQLIKIRVSLLNILSH